MRNDEVVKMTATTSAPSDPVNGTRTLELGTALYWLKEHLAEQINDAPMTISTVGGRTKAEQEILGTLQILVVMYPLAIELALKSLRAHLHAQGKYKYIHNLEKQFSALTVGAKNVNDAQKAMDEARNSWTRYQKAGTVQHTGTLDEFLKDHSEDFVEIRYYDWSKLHAAPLNDFLCCLFSVLEPLIARDPDTKANFRHLVLDENAVS